MDKILKIFLLVFLAALLIAVNYNFLDSKIESALTEHTYANVVRIIDGDTIVVENSTHVRLLGINTPEKGELYHDEAMNSLSSLISNRTVRLEFGNEKTDLYGRTLAYIFLDSKNINLEQVKNGFANVYLLDYRKYESSLKDAWKSCTEENINLCSKSKDACAGCIDLVSLNVKKQTAIFYNNCSFQCSLTGWNIKDEGRKNFFFPKFTLKSKGEVSVIVGNYSNTESRLYWKGESYVWTSTGDTLFLRDEGGGLVLWNNY